MQLAVIENTLARLLELLEADRFEELETDTLEFKALPATGSEWHTFYESVCALLNTRGGIIIIGVKEQGTGPARRYRLTGWRPDGEPKVAQTCRQFKDETGLQLEIEDRFPPPQIIGFRGEQVCAVFVDELSADIKFAFYQGVAYKRILTGDHRIGEVELARQREFRESAAQARELEHIPGIGLDGFDLDKLNEYITALNRPTKIETVKADLQSALPFLERKVFIKNGTATTLGVLVCGKHPVDVLGFRCQVHGYVDVDALQEVVRDKQDFADNVLPLMESSLAYLLRNIQVGVSIERGGMSRPQYPEALLRETVNNALAHRDYSINRQVILVVSPGEYISIRNPGSFRRQLLVEDVAGANALRRILPEAQPRNPKLADVLRVFRKWEGRGIGMATMVNLCLQDEIDVPYYQFGTQEVTLHLCTGQLLDDRMQRLFESYDAYISQKLAGQELTRPQQLVLSYLIKSEWSNERVRYTIMLTPDNNHFNELFGLEHAGLIHKHERSTPSLPIYIADRELMRKNYVPELRQMFGLGFDGLDQRSKDILSVVYRFNRFSRIGAVSAKMASFDLWSQQGSREDIRAFDAFYRQVRYTFNQLEKAQFVKKKTGSRRYILDDRAGFEMLPAGGAV
jgi:ATP-dependent DNA helicase RecG